MPRSNRKSHSKSSTFRRNVTYTQSSNQEVKLTKEQLAADARDQKKFFMILGGITLAILIIVYLLYFRRF